MDGGKEAGDNETSGEKDDDKTEDIDVSVDEEEADNTNRSRREHSACDLFSLATSTLLISVLCLYANSFRSP